MKYLKYINLSLFILVCFLCFTNTIYAQDKTLPADRGIILQKLVIEKNDYPSTSINNNGQALDPSKLPSQIGLNNVQFTLYSLTQELNTLLDSGKSASEAQEILAVQSYDYNTLKVVQTTTTAPFNGQDGIARFNLNDEPITAAYLILETGTPENVSVIADPIIIVFPAYDEQGKILSTIYIYPKNVLKDSTPPSSSSIVPSSVPSNKTSQNSSINGAKTGVNQIMILILIIIISVTFLLMLTLIFYKSKK